MTRASATLDVLPGAFVLFLGLLYALSYIRVLREWSAKFYDPFKPFIVLPTSARPRKKYTFRIVLLLVLAFALVVLRVVILGSEGVNVVGVVALLPPVYILSSLSYSPPSTPPYKILLTLILFLLAPFSKIFSIIHDSIVGTPIDALSVWKNVAELVCVLALIGGILGMPLAIPADDIDPSQIGKEISPEDYSTLFEMITFSWIYPLIRLGSTKTLSEEDVWALSPSMQSRPLFTKFSAIKTKSLVRRIIRANARDLTLDLVLMVVSVILSYASPYFLKQILDALTLPPSTSSPSSPSSSSFPAFSSPTSTSTFSASASGSAASVDVDVDAERLIRATSAALSLFFFQLLKSQADLFHLYHGRRASSRIRSELMCAVYEKALRRRDFGGVTATSATGASTNTNEKGSTNEKKPSKDGKDGTKETKEKDKKEKGKKPKETGKKEDPNAKPDSADIGKIVQLMSSDAERCANMASGIYYLYGAPVEILFAVTFLYQLLGLSTFAGLLPIILLYPFSSYLSKRAVRLSKELLQAKDRRTKILSEVVGGVRGLKWWGWGDPGRWIGRLMRMREIEVGIMIKGRVNTLALNFIWSVGPICVNVLSFASFVLLERKELSVSVAFTSVALLNMLRSPLNTIPQYIVTVLQTRVSVERIAWFLDEEEVEGQFSGLALADSTDSDLGMTFAAADLRGDANIGEDAEAALHEDGTRGGNGDDREEIPRGPGPELGIVNGWFKWNEVDRSTVEGNKNSDGILGRMRGALRSVWKWRSSSILPTTASTSTSAAPAITTSVHTPSHLDASSTTIPNDITSTSASASADASTDADAENAKERRFELRDINVVFPEGKMTVITGPTASGKTALLMALLGEMTTLPSPNGTPTQILLDKQPSKILPNGLTQSLSYASQQPYLQHFSIRQNILFGSPYIASRYNAVLQSCALLEDLALLPEGDATIVGARGVKLSGGQKGRVGLARAVYALSQWVLLDDPLSAVDAGVARGLYEDVLRGPLLSGRTVVLVTHHVELVLPGTDYLVRMKEGRIEYQGAVEELRERGVLEGILKEENVVLGDDLIDDAADEDADADATVKAGTSEEDTEVESVAGAAPGKDKGKASTSSVLKPAVEVDAKTTKAKTKVKTADEEEVRQTGSVKWRVYKAYLVASSYWTWAGLILFLCFARAFEISDRFWIKAWGDAYRTSDSFIGRPSLVVPYSLDQHPLANSYAAAFVPYNTLLGIPLPSANDHPLFYVGIYGALGLLGALMSLISRAIQFTGAIRAARILFSQLLNSVINATLRWHDTTPTGRILSRFSKDITTIDSSIAPSLQSFLASVATFIAAVVTVSTVFPPFLVPAFFIGWLYVKIAMGYINTGRDLRRMESTNRSPIFQGFSELLDGIVTVRAFSAERRFLDDLFEKIDVTANMFYTFWMTNRWLLVYYDILGAASVLVTALMAIAGGVPVGLAGVTITCAMSFTTSVYWACRYSTRVELDLNAVERIVEYLDIPQEPPAIIESNRPPAYWPSKTTKNPMLEVRDLEIRYAPELPSVLNGISFALRAGERIGLLGRTGSGKSTLTMSLLRFVDPHKGSIIMDGIDITSIGLSDLRSKLTFIPQDASLFAGTIRENLDPFGDFTDAECLDVLSRVHMIPPTSHSTPSATPLIPTTEASEAPAPSKPADSLASITLDTKISTGGINFSQGQRQLLALARALLRQSSIVILDEATSSIDFETDQKIQASIREEFSGALLITVAHRLWTIIDYDRLIILDKGRVSEFDTPYNLIRKEGGIFRNMCLRSGMYDRLEEAAKKNVEA
ncbi:hypothetical protein SISNIDRAFT_553186 [Sistotremastrum niveocremeum HHB9708]|uniref:P-loop containing nucleoside triphosphate hydrolase protein n=1 Tax=Sistotremastrum niveocremeum HHB9708 TaxID=1314777 RepID=A0A164N7J8_9AGAM|nr:hypothetical protein SISNIDRAFT_553186 [Sistotremastrum niveocremeum HHB9708]